ncbi:tyrosine-type recombinase/integrase [Wenyingzhuangia sp. chi5]|uniref:Tyrosine-type recombinase/integrase n=1 Tax=Wenyingzhuangia gilva TaxID=3057677 RepID=A0ABT8VUL2_9FLAO|nr:tyrosine-type recombinase/integrase [Wenyingzhuangia sp. chi5]MDO3695652.1 tyrosine-type recombinase/integrase [Wenyingzhuangia sp. chi5]
MKKIILKPEIHKNKEIILIEFDYNLKIKNALKRWETRVYWSETFRCWYALKSEFELNSFYDTFKDLGFVDYSLLKKKSSIVNVSVPKKAPIKERLNEEQRTVLNAFYKYLKGKRFSESTLKTYTNLVAEFVIHQKEIKEFSLRDIELFIEYALVPSRASISTHRQFISAMKHYITFTQMPIEIDFNALAPRKSKLLPNVLSKEEVIELIRVTKNLKHRVCIALIYSSGLRIGELINLKLRDIDLQRQVLKVQIGKGRKDRYIPIANVIMPLLHNYLTTYEPKTYLIEGVDEETPYSTESIRKFLKKSCGLARIIKRVTPHTLRHSYATHLLENGTDIRYIQELLGHSRPETTMVYTHVRSQDLQKITNPLDLFVKQIELQQKNNTIFNEKQTLKGTDNP